MLIVLNNYPHKYEIEQLTRMFSKGTQVVFSTRKNIQGDYLYVRQNRNKVLVALKSNGTIRKAFVPCEREKYSLEMAVALAAYSFYKEVFNKELPWGVLTGIRPVRLMRSLYDKTKDIEKVKDIFSNDYLVSKEKIKLCQDIFNLQKPIIESCSFNDYSLYISIPFCPTRCSYCSFISVPSKNAGELIGQYVLKLCQEIQYTAQMANKQGLELKTIYIGGGTPTAVSAEQLKMIMETVKSCFDLKKVLEYTVEAGRADCTTVEKLQIIKDYGANRVSVNPQTFSDEVLKNIGRKHTHQDFLNCFEAAKKMGFDSINTDLIAGLYLDTVEGFEKSLRGCIDLGAENITVHTLTLKRASDLVSQRNNHSHADIFAMIEKNKILYEAGYLPYYMYRQKATIENLENVGFSQKGHESLYNIYIMEEIQTIISCGAGGVSKVVGKNNEIKRVYNYKYPAEYVRDFETILKRKDEVEKIWRQFGYQNA